MIRESDEDDTDLLCELRNYLSDMQDPTDPERQQMLKAFARLVELCVEVSAQGGELGRVSAIRTSTILRVLAAELTGREVTVEMPGVVTFYPGEVDPRG
jgi:hypothetical protein